MPTNVYLLSDVNPRPLRERLFALIEEQPWILNGWPDTEAEAYKMYAQEYKFGTLLLSVGRNESTQNEYLYSKCQQDLKKAHLYVCLAAWLRPPDDSWVWSNSTENSILDTLHYSLAWESDTKGFLVATRDLLGFEPVKLSPEYELKESQDAARCVRELFKFLGKA